MRKRISLYNRGLSVDYFLMRFSASSSERRWSRVPNGKRAMHVYCRCVESGGHDLPQSGVSGCNGGTLGYDIVIPRYFTGTISYNMVLFVDQFFSYFLFVWALR